LPSNGQCQFAGWQPRAIFLAQLMARLEVGPADLAVKRKKFDRLLER
jgi:hypothetical protein